MTDTHAASPNTVWRTRIECDGKPDIELAIPFHIPATLPEDEQVAMALQRTRFMVEVTDPNSVSNHPLRQAFKDLLAMDEPHPRLVFIINHTFASGQLFDWANELYQSGDPAIAKLVLDTMYGIKDLNARTAHLDVLLHMYRLTHQRQKASPGRPRDYWEGLSTRRWNAIIGSLPPVLRPHYQRVSHLIDLS